MRLTGPRVRMGPPRRVPIVVTVLGILLLAGISGIVSQVPGLATAAASTVASGTSYGAKQLALASQSLESGQGPANGQSVTCSLSSASASASCSAASAVASAISTTAFWNSEVAPSARAGASMTYDGEDRYVLLFGGFNGSGYLGDTWEFLHSQWINLPMKVSPAPRANASMAYDTKDKYVVLFGGQSSGGLLGDTWTYAGGAWTQLSPLTSPSPRIDAAMAYDTHDSYLVLFGGSASGAALGDTWTFAKGAWTQITPTSPPGARWGAAVAYDSLDNYVVLFGGYNGVSFLGDTWVFETGQWTQLSPTQSPSPRYEAMMAFDASPTTNYTLLTGGVSKVGSTWADFLDNWKFVHGTWTQLSLSVVPAARQQAAVAYDTSDKLVLLFSGQTDGDPVTATDTWEYETNATSGATGWVQNRQQAQVALEQPPARYGAAMANDSGKYIGVLLFGGITGFGVNGETWNYSSTKGWTQLFPSVAPSSRAYAAIAWDSHDGYVVLFGGMNAAGTALGDTWTFKDSAWTELSPAGAPSARYGAMMAYDPHDGYVVLFGGTNGAQYFSDTWTFQGGVWTQLAPTTSPPGLAFGGLGWDTAANETILYGGTTGSLASNQTWKYLAGVWTQLHPKGANPAGEWGNTVVTDPKDKYVFMFGGCTAASFNPLSPSCPASDVQGGTWRFKANWSLVATSGLNDAPPLAWPGPRYLADAAWDPDFYTHSPTVTFIDGIGPSGNIIQDRWQYIGAKWNIWYPSPLPEARYGQMETQSVRDEQALMFGGIGEVGGGGIGYLDDTWMWDTGVWGLAAPAHPPSARAFGAVYSYYPGHSTFQTECLSTCYTILFGGVGATGYLGDTWKWTGSPYGGQWTQLTESVHPSARSNATMTFDYVDNYLLLFGGQNSSGVLNDTWSFANGVWTQLHPALSPPAREGQVMEYDSEDGYVVLFGGRAGATYFSDTWKFLGGKWSEMNPTVHPSARVGASMYDSPLPAGYGFMIMLAGYNGVSFLGDTWVFLGGNWTELPTKTASFVPYAWGGMADDVDDGHPNIFGGMTANGIVFDFWEFKKGP